MGPGGKGTGLVESHPSCVEPKLTWCLGPEGSRKGVFGVLSENRCKRGARETEDCDVQE